MFISNVIFRLAFAKIVGMTDNDAYFPQSRQILLEQHLMRIMIPYLELGHMYIFHQRLENA